MEEYIREAPRPSIKSEVSASPFEKQVLDLLCFVTLLMLQKQESEEPKLLTYEQEAPEEPENAVEEEKEEPSQKPEPQPVPDPEPHPQQTTGDLLVFSNLLPDSLL
jgi:hypothetical protein